MIERVVDALLDAALPHGRMDAIGALAAPLPEIVIAELFGIPHEDRELFHDWSLAIARFFGGAVGDPAEAARAANDATLQRERYFRDLMEERRRRPGDDLMSLLLEGQAEGRLTAEEVSAQCILLLTAGHVTTMDQLGNIVLALLMDSEQLRRLRAYPELVPAAVEEGLRYDGTAQFLQRIAREDPRTPRPDDPRAGDLLYLSLGAANRDPEVFAEPDQFDVGRSENRHLAFGGGPHLCLGMTLARARVGGGALGHLVRRMPRLRFDEERPVQRRADKPGVPRSGIAAGSIRLTATGGISRANASSSPNTVRQLTRSTSAEIQRRTRNVGTTESDSPVVRGRAAAQPRRAGNLAPHGLWQRRRPAGRDRSAAHSSRARRFE